MIQNFKNILQTHYDIKIHVQFFAIWDNLV
jgi:hypothetical protein